MIRPEAMAITEDELGIIATGSSYLQMKQTDGWKMLVKHMITYCNSRLDRLQKADTVPNEDSLRMLEQWRASEKMYQDIIAEVEGSIEAMTNKQKELDQLGLPFQELNLGQTV
jgi:hypothetical protein